MAGRDKGELVTNALIDISKLDDVTIFVCRLSRAIDAATELMRMQRKQGGFFRRIMPVIAVTNDELDRQVDTDKPIKVVDK